MKSSWPAKGAPAPWLAEPAGPAACIHRLTEGLTQELCQTGAVHFVIGHIEHRLVGGEFRQTAGVDAVDFQKV